MLYMTKYGSIVGEEELNRLDPLRIEALGIHVLEDPWDNWDDEFA